MSGDAVSYGAAQAESIERLKSMGGYPANVVIDEAVAGLIDAQSGLSPAKPARAGRRGGSGFGFFDDDKSADHVGVWPASASGGASRFFYTAKASTSERDKGLESLPAMTPGQRSGGREDGSAGINGYAGTRGETGRNPHPTVKPISLMRYLVRRASPPGAWDPDMVKRPVVLDCFMGSGSTGVAAMVEGVRFVGCELGEESAEVARLRLQHAYALPRKDGEAPVVTRVGGQGKLF
jgi:site-specific DNA-methyltransferase (adenine-specific)